MPKPKTILAILFIIGIVFLLGGGIDCINTFLGGEQNAGLIEQPKMTGLSPVSILLYCFGFMGLFIFYLGGTNLKTNQELAQKQIITGLIK